MALQGVLFDFSGTLFHVESAADAVSAALGPAYAGHASELARLGAINGSSPPADLRDDLRQVWDVRDLSAEKHREAYSGSARRAGLSADEAARLYERGISPDAWSPFVDTVSALRSLRARGVRIAVVSNIGWDPRPIFDRHEVTDLIDALVLSYEVGVQKPDAGIFEIALHVLDLAAEDCVMVGDSRAADGGSVDVGVPYVWVSPDPDERTASTLLGAALSPQG